MNRDLLNQGHLLPRFIAEVKHYLGVCKYNVFLIVEIEVLCYPVFVAYFRDASHT